MVEMAGQLISLEGIKRVRTSYMNSIAYDYYITERLINSMQFFGGSKQEPFAGNRTDYTIEVEYKTTSKVNANIQNDSWFGDQEVEINAEESEIILRYPNEKDRDADYEKLKKVLTK